MSEKKQYFELIGYSKDFYSKDKYLGSINIAKKDREKLGYSGRIKETLKVGVSLNNKKTILKNTEVFTELIELNGRML